MNARRAGSRARRVAVGLPVGFFVRCRCTRLRLPLAGAARQAEGLQDPICNALSVRSEVTGSPERKQVHHAHECMLLVYGGEVGARPCSPNAGRKVSAHRATKKAPFLQHERHLLVATWFTKLRPPSMKYIPRHLIKPRVMCTVICQPQTRK